MDMFEYNRRAWDAQVAKSDRWTVPVDPERVQWARKGEFEVLLTATKPVPRHWFPADLGGLQVLGLASAGGQQGPLLAAAGAEVTIFDASPAQLGQDRAVATREELSIRTVEGDMRDLSAFDDASFDLVFHPCSNCFVAQLEPVWQEAFRVLRPGGELLCGFIQPHYFLFDEAQHLDGKLVVRHKLPLNEATDLKAKERDGFMEALEPLQYGHTFESQLGGQLDAGFVLVEMYEDGDESYLLSEHIALYMATRARKPLQSAVDH